MAANIQWDVATKDGKDPKTGNAYTPLVRMLYNETEVPFNVLLHAGGRRLHLVQGIRAEELPGFGGEA